MFFTYWRTLHFGNSNKPKTFWTVRSGFKKIYKKVKEHERDGVLHVREICRVLFFSIPQRSWPFLCCACGPHWILKGRSESKCLRMFPLYKTGSYILIYPMWFTFEVSNSRYDKDVVPKYVFKMNLKIMILVRLDPLIYCFRSCCHIRSVIFQHSTFNVELINSVKHVNLFTNLQHFNMKSTCWLSINQNQMRTKHIMTSAITTSETWVDPAAEAVGEIGTSWNLDWPLKFRYLPRGASLTEF